MNKKIFPIFCVLVFSMIFLILDQASAQILEPRSGKSLATQEVADLEEDVEEDALTQEEFAVEMVKIMEIEDLLPLAALPSDCVALLERLGIAPLNGWSNKAKLSQEDYLVMIGKAQGKEGLIHQRAVSVEEKNIEIINQKWKGAYDDTGSWPALSEFLNNSTYFPSGAPKSPYGRAYRDDNGDHKVDPVFLPIAELIELRESLSTK